MQLSELWMLALISLLVLVFIVVAAISVYDTRIRNNSRTHKPFPKVVQHPDDDTYLTDEQVYRMRYPYGNGDTIEAVTFEAPDSTVSPSSMAADALRMAQSNDKDVAGLLTTGE